MAENVQQPIEVPVPLSLFGGLVTEMSPSDLPEGVSPDCQDIVFYPGGIASRPGMKKWITGLGTNKTVTYQKTYLTPQGLIRNLILTSDGSFWIQKPEISLVPAVAFSVTPGSYASSVTAFGKELITFHNTITGTDVPRIYDGVFFDRATQCGPAIQPNVATVSLPTVNMAVAGGAPTATIVTVVPIEITQYGTPPNLFFFYAAVVITVTAALPASVQVGTPVTVTGTSTAILNQTYSITQVVSSTQIICAANLPYPPAIATGNGGTATFYGSTTLIRNNNQVTAQTSANHNLQKGFQVKIAGVPDSSVGGGISSIVIANEQNPGVATVTTGSAHGLLPGNIIQLLGVSNTTVGGGISSVSRAGQVVTVVTTAAHGLQAGVSVLIAGVTDTHFNGQFVVATVVNTTTFTYVQADADATSSGGTVALVWPVSNASIIPTYYTVIAAPTATTFTVSVFYSDGTWTGGTVTFPWAGTFYVTQILSPTIFTYQQYGPNATTNTVGTVTPFSQVAPGTRSCVVLFQTRQGLITAPGPPLQKLVTPGGQYISVSGLPIGSPDVIARILAFTGADGGNYFYIPTPATVNGLQVSTSTVINDNVTTNMIIDFGDPTLFNSISIDIPGNNLFEMQVLGPCLGVASYASRAGWFGMKNSIPNFLNLGFEAGYSNQTNPLNFPSGWTVPAFYFNNRLTVTDNGGFAWLITSQGSGGVEGQLTQPAYLDAFNVPILQPSTLYSFGIKINVIQAPFGNNTGQITIDFFSPANGVLATASIQAVNMTSGINFYSAVMSLSTPAAIPLDTILRVYSNNLVLGVGLTLDDIEIYPTLNPVVPQFRWSYINLPDSVDAETSQLGAAADTTQIQSWFTHRDTFLFLTQYGLHETNDLAGFEPNGWEVREVAHNCGGCGPLAITTGENFSAWVSAPSALPAVGRGLYLYTGGSVYKLSQEVQPDFDAINNAAQSTIWVTNDPVTRRIYMGLPKGAATAPNVIYIMDYREMDTASEIAAKAPIHISFTGKMICSDLSRKWTRWSISANRGDILSVPGVGIQFVVAGGTGSAPTATGIPGSYYFNSTTYTDDDFGQIVPYYTTYFFINHEMEMSFQVGLHRKLYKRYSVFIQGLGNLLITPYGDNLTNPWPFVNPLVLNSNQLYDLGDGLNVIAERCAFKISCTPAVGTDNWFNLNKFVVSMMQEPVAPIRFGAI